MYSVLKNDIDAARTKKYGFADHCVVLQAKQSDGADICLVLSVDLRCGRSALKTVRTYLVYRGSDRIFASSRKADANKVYKQS